jgi:NAD+ synthase (glutamine-hydrolysing)
MTQPTPPSDFLDIRKHGFVRTAVAVPRVRVGDPHENVKHHLEVLEPANRDGAYYAVCPELSLTGYTCADLFHSQALLEGALEALACLLEATRSWDMGFSVGMPLQMDHAVFNVAVTCAQGQILSVTPKTYLPQYREFYEARYFARAAEAQSNMATLCGQTVPFGPDVLIRTDDPRVVIYPTICEDDWVPIPPSARAALAGATILANLSASNIVIGKAQYREELILASSGRSEAAHLYAAAGFGESTMDTVWDGHAFITERGYMLARSDRFCMEGTYVTADIDVEALVLERGVQGSFRQNAMDYKDTWRSVVWSANLEKKTAPSPVHHTFKRHISPHPFVPHNLDERDERCHEVFMIQSSGLATKLMSLPEDTRKVIIGVSGGQDSTHALNVAVHTMDMLKLPRTNVVAITMPGFGTTDRTYDNACTLIQSVGATFHEIDIKPVVRQFFADIDHSEDKQNLVYENTQAWSRKLEEMATAAKVKGIVLGTGDLSELALGWCTMFGDHASHYGINAGIPKTLISYLIKWTAEVVFKDEIDVQEVLMDILATPISPELLPPEEGEIAQKTEEKIGPYELHDFYTYYLVRFGFSPSRIARMCLHAFEGKYDLATIKSWLRVYITRFFQNQFKRNCLPEGPKVGLTCISPRGDWRMPSDASPAIWLADLDQVPDEV